MANAVLKEYLSSSFRVTGGSTLPDNVAIRPISKPTAILCRTNGLAMRRAMNLIANGKNVNLVADKVELEKLLKAIDALKNGRQSRHPEIGLFHDIDSLANHAATPAGADLRPVMKMYHDFGAQKLLDVLGKVKSAGDADITIVTAHKSKGMEFETVVIERDFAVPSDERFSEEEGNLLYVAITRAKRTLDISRHEGLMDLWRYVEMNPARAAL